METQVGAGSSGRKVTYLVAASLLFSFATALGVSNIAEAANNCQSNKACLYGFSNYTKLLSTKSGGAGLSNLTGASKNETASWGNDSNYYGCLYDNAGGTGTSWRINPRSSASLGTFSRDRAESWKLNGTGC